MTDRSIPGDVALPVLEDYKAWMAWTGAFRYHDLGSVPGTAEVPPHRVEMYELTLSPKDYLIRLQSVGESEDLPIVMSTEFKKLCFHQHIVTSMDDSIVWSFTPAFSASPQFPNIMQEFYSLGDKHLPALVPLDLDKPENFGWYLTNWQSLSRFTDVHHFSAELAILRKFSTTHMQARRKIRKEAEEELSRCMTRIDTEQEMRLRALRPDGTSALDDQTVIDQPRLRKVTLEERPV